jgi:predicted Zn finger-like uncharacterized protein
MFRVDPERVPPNGVKARCARCSNVFELTREGVKGQPASVAPAPAPTPKAERAAQASAPAPLTDAAEATASGPRLVVSPAQERAAPRPIPVGPPPGLSPQPAPSGPAAPSASTATEARPGKRPSFRNQDPAARAQRLARALVSDIVAYNKERLQRTAGAAALRSEFRDEIRKSWEEYVEQVGLDVAKNTPYFRDALNEMLAKGSKIF